MPERIRIGQFHALPVSHFVDFGAYVNAGWDDVLVPRKYLPGGLQVGDTLRVFIYRDSEDRLIGTTQEPYATADSFAYLRVMDATKYGIFLDWGLEKDLLLPFAEQSQKMIPGKKYVVRVYVDDVTDRVIASARLEKFLHPPSSDLTDGQAVDLLVWNETELGYKVIVSERYDGMLFRNEVFTPVRTGDYRKGFVKKIRPDGKVDVTLRQTGYAEVTDARQLLVKRLEQNGGFLPYTDRTHPDDIYRDLHISKRTFKQAVGGLLKAGVVRLHDDGIHLIPSD